METRNNIENKGYKASHPGKLVAHWLDEEGIKRKYLAEKMGIHQSRLSEFIHGKRDMTETLASKLSEHLGMDAEYWMRLQSQYENDNRVFSVSPQEEKGTLKARLSDSAKVEQGEEYSFSMNLYLFEEGNIIVAYCPSLALSSSGKTYNNAVANLYDAFQLYIETSIAAGTLEKDLSAHGWTIQANRLIPPSYGTVKNDPELVNLLNSSKPFRRVSVPMSFAY